MRRLATLAAVLVLLTAPTALAQPEPGDAGVFGDPDATFSRLSVVPYVPFLVHAFVFDPPGGIQAFEIGFAGLPVQAIVLSIDLLGGPPITLGELDPTNLIIGLGQCVSDPGPLPLASLTLLAFAPVASDTAIGLTGTSPSTFDGSPGYADCAGEVRAFTAAPYAGCFGWETVGSGYPPGALILNPSQSCPLSGDDTTFGAMKARF